VFAFSEAELFRATVQRAAVEKAPCNDAMPSSVRRLHSELLRPVIQPLGATHHHSISDASLPATAVPCHYHRLLIGVTGR